MRKLPSGAAHEVDAWALDDFEDTVASALITCFEQRIRKSRGAGPNTLNEERAARVRASGIYIPGNDRMVIAPANLEGRWEFDTRNDCLPVSGCVGMTAPPSNKPGQYGGWFRAIHVRQVSDLGRNWHRRGSGQLYELTYMASQNEYSEGERSFFSVSSTGVVKACEVRLQDLGRSGGKRLNDHRTPEHQLSEIEACASTTLQFIADSRFCWQIEARESGAFARLGCMHEQIKSLLYARTLPLSATGRRRPILHLVEAHKRRLKAGLDIDISGHLRGIQSVEIGGTQFVVRPAKALISDLPNTVKTRECMA